MKITVKDTSAAFVEAMNKRSGNIAFASAVALTRTAQKVKAAQIDLMQQKLDRPTKWTLNSLMLKPATKTKLEAVVQTKEGFGSVPAGRYLSPLIEGGSRREKSSEKRLKSYWTPARAADLDASGNVRGSTMNKILSQLKLRADPTQNASSSKRSKAKRAKEAYFIQNGVVFRQERKAAVRDASGKIIEPRVNGPLQPVLLLHARAPSYRKMLPWYETAQEVIDQSLPSEFFKALDEFKD